MKASSGGTYKQVKQPWGGGCREKKLDANTDYNQIMELAKEYFFPSGISAHHGPLKNFNIHLASFDGTEIDAESFHNIGSYILKYGLVLPRIYLMTERKERVSFIILFRIYC